MPDFTTTETKEITTMNIFITKAAAVISAVLFIAVSSSCSGNGASETQSTTSAATTEPITIPEPLLSTEKTFFPDTDHAKHIGRTLTENDTLWLAHSASGIEFTFRGTKAEMEIVGDSAAFGQTDSQARFAVYVNGERTMDEMVKDYSKVYEIFSSDETEDVTVKIIKLSESQNSSFGIKNITVFSEGGCSPTPEKDMKIEFIGDSITCAYGVDDENKDHHFSTTTEDATKSYAYKTAQKLDADYSLVSYSGYGIISGYTGNPDKQNKSQLVPAIYEQFARCGGSSVYYTETTPWDFSSFVPDYIVINLGTNDDSYIKNKQEKKDEFVKEYCSFIKTVRSDNPDAYIICALGIMGDSLYSSVEKAVEQYTSETGDTNVSAFRFDVQDMNANGIAADWHPSEKTHEVSANKLAEYIKTLKKN
ncbi:MAG: GDSL family lipase [Ruminiclostridium sp.]|nr:GDSL family lipase [Ruminiclostridium sp.]